MMQSALLRIESDQMHSICPKIAGFGVRFGDTSPSKASDKFFRLECALEFARSGPIPV